MTDATRQGLQAVLLSVALMGFWIACVSNRQPDDWLVGAGAVILSSAFSLFVVRSLPLHFRPSIQQIAQIWRLPWYVVSDLAQIVWVLVLDFLGKPAPSLFRSVPWRPVERDGRASASRTLAVAYTTISPNMVVIGIDTKRGQMLFHQLRKSGVPQMTRNLGAEAGQ